MRRRRECFTAHSASGHAAGSSTRFRPHSASVTASATPTARCCRARAPSSKGEQRPRHPPSPRPQAPAQARACPRQRHRPHLRHFHKHGLALAVALCHALGAAPQPPTPSGSPTVAPTSIPSGLRGCTVNTVTASSTHCTSGTPSTAQCSSPPRALRPRPPPRRAVGLVAVGHFQTREVLCHVTESSSAPLPVSASGTL